METWWPSNGTEPYWLEVTQRYDLGEELWHYRYKAGGHGELVTTMLLDEMARGDRVLHYDRRTRSIVGVSTVSGEHAEPRRKGGWAARARQIHGFRLFEQPIGLDLIRKHSSALARVQKDLLRQHGPPLRFPFTWTDGSLRPAQVYLAKFPVAAISAVPELLAAAEGRQPTGKVGQPLGPVDTKIQTSEGDPFSRDPDVVDRGLRAHRKTQEALRKHLVRVGRKPLARRRGVQEPDFDIAWYAGDQTLWVAEIKSVTTRNEDRQLRLGLGQLLHYRHLLVPRAPKVKAALVLERPPAAESWHKLCNALDITLSWPERFRADFR